MGLGKEMVNAEASLCISNTPLKMYTIIFRRKKHVSEEISEIFSLFILNLAHTLTGTYASPALKSQSENLVIFFSVYTNSEKFRAQPSSTM